jgi:hypothetical protein
MNPAPDADVHSVGPANFEWIVNAVAELAVEKAKTAPLTPVLQAQALLSASVKGAAAKAAAKTKSAGAPVKTATNAPAKKAPAKAKGAPKPPAKKALKEAPADPSATPAE